MTTLALSLVVAGPSLAGQSGDARHIRGRTMGTTYSVVLGGEEPTAEERARLAAVVEAELAQVDRLMSTYRSDSELSRFNRHQTTTPFAVSPATLAVFALAREISESTGGAFDVTVAPLVAAWGFGAAARSAEPQLPRDAELARLREHVGYRLVEVDLAAGTLRKLDPQTQCDLSAIAKGYAVDRVAAALIARGRRDFLVEVGGDLRAVGHRAGGAPWRVAIERPATRERSLFRVVELIDLALATSGDYRNFYERAGRRYSHLIDPRTGRPIGHAVASTSVVHTDAAQADAFATALSVMGPEKGYDFAAARGLAAYFIAHAADGGLVARATPAFEEVLRIADRGATGSPPSAAPVTPPPRALVPSRR